MACCQKTDLADTIGDEDARPTATRRSQNDAELPLNQLLPRLTFFLGEL